MLRMHPDGAGHAPAEVPCVEPKPARAATEVRASTVEKELLNDDESAGMCGRSTASWWRDHAAARVPAPVRLGGSTRWRRRELLAWIEAGCPPRKTWEALEKARKAGR
jgi:predicted DNA-binding transcriptional regulator AlpA